MTVEAPGPVTSTRSRRADLTAHATAAAYQLGWAVVRRVPERLAYRAFRVAADVVWRRRGRSVLRYEENVRPLLDDGVSEAKLREVSRAAMRSYLRYWCEAFRLGATDAAVLVSRVRADGEQHVREPLAAGRGVVCALPHMANWDHAGAWVVLTGGRLATVAERLEPASLYDAFVTYRESLGMQVLALDDPGAFATLATRLKQGWMVALVADRDLTSRGVGVRFGGGRTRMPAGPAALALRTGCDLVPVTLWYEGSRLRLRFHAPVVAAPGLHGAAAVADLTQQVADVFAAGVAEHPHDWHMLARFWLDEPVGPEQPGRPDEFVSPAERNGVGG